MTGFPRAPSFIGSLAGTSGAGSANMLGSIHRLFGRQHAFDIDQINFGLAGSSSSELPFGSGDSTRGGRGLGARAAAFCAATWRRNVHLGLIDKRPSGLINGLLTTSVDSEKSRSESNGWAREMGNSGLALTRSPCETPVQLNIRRSSFRGVYI
jgi:hypothetical protein